MRHKESKKRKVILMGAVLRFIAWAAGQVWRYGIDKIGRVSAWARDNWRTVLGWLDKGVAAGTIIEWIISLLGLQ
ncbi:hypothetical protein [Rathayibacter festucae]|uniref:hypothetical protein n=1 Tax=Rathayibacter festucae TaxID=110937 RepID=UPI002A6A1616|nr:hypothetical protein [Rathayibacter festucae]MDY0914658.1 hypothetical protein [Rathayibacter festucae]